jgi:hypothetical protein
VNREKIRGSIGIEPTPDQLVQTPVTTPAVAVFRWSNDHMIRRPEDLPQKALFRDKPNMEEEIKEDRNPGGRMG